MIPVSGFELWFKLLAMLSERVTGADAQSEAVEFDVE